MKHLTTFLLSLLLFSLPTSAQTGESLFSFKFFLQLMQYGSKGQSLDTYKKYAANHNLSLIYHAEESSEIYMVWADQLTYKTAHMTESYTPTGDNPCCMNLDLTPNGKNKYTPISVTLVFPTLEQREMFRQEGMGLGCVVNDQIEDSDIDVTWSHVTGIKYIMNPKLQTSWRFIYFYEKDGLFMCTFLF